jgi:ClpP class serine protease
MAKKASKKARKRVTKKATKESASQKAQKKRTASGTRPKGLYTKYLDAKLNGEQLARERKKQLARIAKLRKRDVFVYAADARKSQRAEVRIVYDDLVAINDQLSVLSNKSVDVILETTGGLAEVAEDFVKQLRSRFDRVGFIIPGQAKSAGTIIVMSGDEILMEPASSLGPIDPQVTQQGKVFSAHVFLEGFERIKEEVNQTNKLNRAYIPILQSISPGEIQACENAQNFSKSLVSKWLHRYKFNSWVTHSQTGQPVTKQEKVERAKGIADALCDHSRWLTHARSVKIEDLREMGLRIVDFSEQGELCDAIRRYHILLQMTFGGSSYKVFETPSSQIIRHVVVGQQPARPTGGVCELEVECIQCHTKAKVQANLGKKQPIKPGSIVFPRDNRFICPACGAEQPLDELRRNIEGQAKMPIV